MNDTLNNAELHPNHLVAIGASAGGLSALEKLFAALPSNTNACFVVIQHLSPNYPSHMSELLSRHTSMKVRHAEHGSPLLANTIFLIPPGQELKLKDGCFDLTERKIAAVSDQIDTFFTSAANLGPQIAAVVLTGTGSDGSVGVKVIAQNQGSVFIQDPDTADFPGMPHSALSQVEPTFVGNIDGLAHALEEWWGGDKKASTPASESTAQEKLLKLLLDACSVDFALYKPGTINRRIERRMGIAGVDNIDDYVSLVSGDTGELQHLVEDLLIGVTSFFRDPDVFTYVKSKVLPLIFENRDQQENDIRLWVPGCATGQEAYTLAMLLDEHASRIKFHGNLRIFATDVHPQSLETANIGIYNEEELRSIPEDYRKRYIKLIDGNRGRVSARLREMIVFAPHNILVDPPFKRIDFISCRNMLIYFNNSAQDIAISAFRYGLRKNGVLLMGSSEGVGSYENDFKALDSQCKIYQAIRSGSLPLC